MTSNLKQLLSPLRWMGAKRRLVPHISKYIPPDTQFLCCPFCGGCSLEFSYADRGVKVYASDSSELLIDFWKTVQSNPEELVDVVKKYFLPMPPSTYYWAKKEVRKLKSNTFRTAMFYAINRASFSGAGLDGGLEPGHPDLTVEKTERLLSVDLSNILFTHCSFEDALGQHPDVWLYLDPPYMGIDLSFGEDNITGSNFDHLGLRDLLKMRGKWVLSYDNNPTILQLYAGYKIKFPDLTYATRSKSGTGSRDIIILSNDIEGG